MDRNKLDSDPDQTLARILAGPSPSEWQSSPLRNILAAGPPHQQYEWMQRLQASKPNLAQFLQKLASGEVLVGMGRAPVPRPRVAASPPQSPVIQRYLAEQEAARQAMHRAEPDYGGAPRSTAGPSISRNLNTTPNQFDYTLFRDGEQIGMARGSVHGERVVLDDIYADSPNSLGVGGLRQLREAFRRDFPDAKIFEGDRVSGARVGPASRKDADAKQSVRLEGWGFPLGAYGLTGDYGD